MSYTFKLSRRIARFRATGLALILALVGCNSTDSLDPEGSISPSQQTVTGSAVFAGGIPIGMFGQPLETFGGRYNGGMMNIWPNYLLSELAEIKAKGGRVALTFTGSQDYFKTSQGHFDLNKWKARVDRFKSVDFSGYVNDGTVIGHYLIDEPNDATNWNGQPIPPSVVEEMARYSKQLWPSLPTLVRVDPDYLDHDHRYVDAAWAQYLSRRGPVDEYIRRVVSDAQARGLGLVVGLNVLRGGTPNGTAMTAKQVEEYGSALLSSGYPCAFLSWKHDAGYVAGSAMGAAMDALRRQAQNRSGRTCRRTAGGQLPEEPPPPAEPPPPSPTADPLPFGLSFAPLEEYSGRWTGAVYQAEPSLLGTHLARAENYGMKLVVMMAGAAQSKNADGTFSLDKWKAQVRRFRELSLERHLSSGTLYLHHLVEQPRCASCWGGTPIAWQTIEEMARYSKSLWPALPTAVRVPPSTLAQANVRWTYLDAGWAQYSTPRGDLRTFLANEVAEARGLGLGLVAGLNLLDGSGTNTAPMTAAQVQAFGTILAKEPSVCALIGWRYDPAYLNQSGMRQALDVVAAAAKARTRASCRVG